MSLEKPQPQQKKDVPMPTDVGQKEQTTIPPEVLEHVKKMKVIVDNSAVKCVDGGYQENEESGAMAIAGGHLGVSLALLRLGYKVPDAYKLVYDFARSKKMKYGWHTDKHEGHNGVVCGCGHCNTAIAQGEQYGVKSDDARMLFEIIREATANDQEGSKVVVLDREHNEQGILVITGTEYTVKPWDQAADRQYFIYDQTRHQNFLKEFVEYLQQLGRDTTYENLLEASNAQTNSTLGLLGSSKGKPMYTVNVDSETPEIAFLMNAPVL